MGTSEYDPGLLIAERGTLDAKSAQNGADLGNPPFLDHHRRLRDRASLDVAIDSKLRAAMSSISRSRIS